MTLKTFDITINGDPISSIQAPNLDTAAQIAASRAQIGETIEIVTDRKTHRWIVGALGITKEVA